MAAYNVDDMYSDDDIDIIEYIDNNLERQRIIIIRPEHFFYME